MVVEIETYIAEVGDLIVKLRIHLEKVKKYARPLFTFDDDTIIEFSQADKVKLLTDTRNKVLYLETVIIPSLKQALEMT